MRRRAAPFVRTISALIVLASCGSSSGTATSTTVPTPSTSPPPAGLTNVWLPAAIETMPTLQLSFRPDRLWLWSILPAGDGIVMLQGDDNGNSFISARDSAGERWRTNVDESTSLAVAGDLALTVTHDPDDRLIGLSLDDGAVVVDQPLAGSTVAQIGDHVVITTLAGQTMRIASFDPARREIDELATFDLTDEVILTDRGVLVLGTGATTLVDIAHGGALIRWPVALRPLAPPDTYGPGTVAVAGDLLVGVATDRRLVAVAPSGETVGVIADRASGLTDVWAAGDGLIVTAGTSGLEVTAIDGAGVTKVGHLDGPGRLGPTAVVDGTGYLTWYADGRGRVLRVTSDGLSEVVTFTEQTSSDVDDEALAEQVRFVDAAIYVAERRTTPGDRAQLLTAYALDGSTLWTLSSPLLADWEASWDLNTRLIVLRLGYSLIPGQVDVYG